MALARRPTKEAGGHLSVRVGLTDTLDTSDQRHCQMAILHSFAVTGPECNCCSQAM